MTVAAPCLELVRVDPRHGGRWIYETPAGGHVAVVWNQVADGFVAHRSNETGSWLGPRLVSGHALGRGRVLELLEDQMEAGRL